MTDPATIFQRTHSGREEIHKKSHGLTQSERLVLIMVDGVTTYKEIRAKLPVLSDERFERALQKLQAKELVLEVFMPLEGQTPDELERTVIDRFLQQDPMDPLTVILQDPEDELGMLSQSRKKLEMPATTRAEAEYVPSAERMAALETDVATADAPEPSPRDFPTLADPIPKEQPPQPEPALDAHHVMLADALSAELKAKWAAKPMPTTTRIDAAQAVTIAASEPKQELSPFVAVHWGYWLIVAGLAFILGFVLARITS